MSVQKFNARSRINNQVIPYTQVNTAVIQTITNPEAGFVWIYLLSKPSSWVIIKAHIKNHFGFGDKKIKTIFAYLHLHNLIKYHQVRTEDGRRISHTDIEVLNGDDFVINPPLRELSTTHASTGSIINPVESCTRRKEGTIKKRDNKALSFKEKKQRREDSIFFKPSETNREYALINNIDLELEVQRFNEKYPYKKTQYAFKRWLESAIDYRTKIKPSNEIRSTVPWFGDNH